MAPSTLCTIGYQGASMSDFLDALRHAKVELLVDVRAVTSSRRPGFSKNALTATLDAHGIAYLHLRGLGTPADGRAAARAGRHAEMRRIFAAHMKEPQARDDIETLVGIVRSGQRVCLLCFEADAAHCHRAIVADAVRAATDTQVDHLAPEQE